MNYEIKYPASEVMQNYKRSLKGINEVIEVHNKVTPYQSEKIVIYTDGSAKGNIHTYDQKGFCGWSWVAKRADGTYGMRCGYRDNADSNEAELHAILNAIAAVEIPSKVLIVTDSQHALYYLNSMNEILSATGEEKYHKTGLTRFGQSKELIDEHIRILAEIREKLDSNPMIESLNVQWVRSHVLDEYKGKQIYIDANGENHRELIYHLMGNLDADYWASKGANRAIENAVNYALKKSAQCQPYNYDTSIGNPEEIIKKNFSSSFHSRSHAIDYMIKRGLKNFNLGKVDEIIGKGSLKTLHKANEVWKRIRSVSVGIEYNPQDMDLRNHERELMRQYRSNLGLKSAKRVTLQGRKPPKIISSVLERDPNVELITKKEASETNDAIQKYALRYSMFKTVSISEVNVDAIKEKLQNNHRTERENCFTP